MPDESAKRPVVSKAIDIILFGIYVPIYWPGSADIGGVLRVVKNVHIPYCADTLETWHDIDQTIS